MSIIIYKYQFFYISFIFPYQFRHGLFVKILNRIIRSAFDLYKKNGGKH